MMIARQELIILKIIRDKAIKRSQIMDEFDQFLKKHNIPEREIKSLASYDKLWKTMSKFRELGLIKTSSETLEITKEGKRLLRAIGDDPHKFPQEIPIVDGEILLTKQGRFSDIRGRITI